LDRGAAVSKRLLINSCSGRAGRWPPEVRSPCSTAKTYIGLMIAHLGAIAAVTGVAGNRERNLQSNGKGSVWGS